MGQKRGLVEDCDDGGVPTKGIFHVRIESRILGRVAQVIAHVVNLLRVCICRNDARANSNRKWVSYWSDYASVGLVESVSRICHILPNLHLNSIHTNVVNGGPLQRKQIFISFTLGRQIQA